MLEGTGHYADTQQQIHMDRLTFRQCTDIALMAWCKSPNTKAASGFFVTIQQGSTEPYLDFINHLEQSISCQVDNQEAAKVLLQQLAYENANADCQAAVASI